MGNNICYENDKKDNILNSTLTIRKTANNNKRYNEQTIYRRANSKGLYSTLPVIKDTQLEIRYYILSSLPNWQRLKVIITVLAKLQ